MWFVCDKAMAVIKNMLTLWDKTKFGNLTHNQKQLNTGELKMAFAHRKVFTVATAQKDTVGFIMSFW